jgi:hypothetical protein
MSDAQQPPSDPFAPPSYPPAPTPPLSPQTPASQRFPTWKQAFVMFGGGLALAVSACFGCLFTLDLGGRGNNAFQGLSMFLAILAFGGLLATLVGVVFVLMRIGRALFAKKDANGISGSGKSGSAS